MCETSQGDEVTTQVIPDWLQSRGGSLKSGVRPETTFVMLEGNPLYKLEVRPATGKFACAVGQTNNGHRLDDPKTTYADSAGALAGGLEQLRTALGW
jgi:hypothetical protein